MMILLNPRAGGGNASGKWRRLAANLPRFREAVDIRILSPELNVASVVDEAISRHNGHLLAAGGDGTVNVILNAIMRLPDAVRHRVVLGAIGLGSSNDFHKPFAEERIVEGIPLRVNFHQPGFRDVGQAFISLKGESSLHHFVINSSAGITAEGNAIFNSPGPLLRVLKAYSTPAAILYAALMALATHKNLRCSLEIHGQPQIHMQLTNLGVVKSPHFSGSLSYGTPSHFNDGAFGVHAAEGMGFIERLKLLRALSKGRFDGIPKTLSTVAPRLILWAPSPFILELDGEIRTADRVEFSVVSQAIKVCS
jgi:diacylglycerol kinase (ATP)